MWTYKKIYIRIFKILNWQWHHYADLPLQLNLAAS
uniref:Uncharacterized protein n=1 Tax=Anguilla anguilla TaxID=7936 RepID=A0A0E9V1I5_ANGAN